MLWTPSFKPVAGSLVRIGLTIQVSLLSLCDHPVHTHTGGGFEDFFLPQL